MTGFWSLVLGNLGDIALFLWFIVLASQVPLGLGLLVRRVYQRRRYGHFSRRRALFTFALIVLALIGYLAVFHATSVYFYDAPIPGYTTPPGWPSTFAYLFAVSVMGAIADLLVYCFHGLFAKD